MSRVIYNEKNCEYIPSSSPNGGYELWIYKPTQKIIRVPIQTIRAWDEAEEEQDMEV